MIKRDMIDSIENVLNNNGFISYKVLGKSMEPMIVPNKDIITIKKKTNSIKLYENDVVLYRQKGKLILHRIVEILPNGEYVILGDNCSRKEYGIFEKDIIAVLTSFKHNGVHYETTNQKYLEYIERLRDSEHTRTKRKLLYDIIVQHLQFLPNPLFSILKSILKRFIVYKITFI